MDDETRTQKILRELNASAETVKGMSSDQKRVFAIVILVVALIAIGMTWAFSAELEINYQCIEDRCMVNKKDLETLIEHNNAVTLKLERMRKLHSLSET